MDIGNVKVYAYATNYVQGRIAYHKSMCDGAKIGSEEYEHSLGYLLYWKREYEQITAARIGK